MLEVGCGNSNWLPYFAQRWKLSVEGIDYSEEGCRLAREIMSRNNLPGTIYLGDLFSPPQELIGRFDVVISAGVVEHFEEQGGCLSAIRAFLKPAGRMITIVPNLCGWMGDITRWLTPDIYAVHIPTSREKLRTAHQVAGMQVLYCDYFLPIHLGVLNLASIRSHWIRMSLGHGANILSSALNSLLLPFRHRVHSRRLSPYVLCIAKNTADRPSE
ncbi:class I SAM-dependent methyltransferase [bacterium]|nr:class I SAM-dependent methyltransferase [bacterium]